MTIATIVQNCAYEMGLPNPSTVVGSTDNFARQMLAIAHRVGDLAISSYEWPELSKKKTITLTASDTNYALPLDFDRFINRTAWDQTNDWEIVGPISSQEYEWRTEGIGVSGPRRRFLTLGNGIEQFIIDPSPDSADSLSFRYQTKSWIRPQVWVTGTNFGASAYCFYDGNYYQTTSGGVAGATPPTHTSGTASDDTVDWIYQSEIIYDQFLADTDVALIDEKTLELGIQSHFLFRKGLAYQEIAAAFQDQLRRQSTSLKGAKTLSLVNNRQHLISSANIPDTGYGS